MEISFNDILNIRALIGRETKNREIYDYVGTIGKGIRMAKNGAKKRVSLALQAKEGPEKFNSRAKPETANIKAELRSVMEGSKRGEQ